MKDNGTELLVDGSFTNCGLKATDTQVICGFFTFRRRKALAGNIGLALWRAGESWKQQASRTTFLS